MYLCGKSNKQIKMEKSKVDFFLAANSDKFEPSALMQVKEILGKANENELMALSSVSYWNPTIILVIAIFLGWERLFLNDIGLGILKIVTCYGCGIWWLIDLFTAVDRTKKYNFKKFMEAAAIME